MDAMINYAERLNTSEGYDEEMLKKSIADFPASALPRFLLLYRLKKEGRTEFQQSLQQFAPYLHNPLWARFLLMHDGVQSASTLYGQEDKEAINESSSGEEADGVEQISTQPSGAVEPLPGQEDNNGIQADQSADLSEEHPVVMIPDETALPQANNTGSNDIPAAHEEQEDNTEETATAEDAGAGSLPAPVETDTDKEAALPFEPLHTIDYFASQGIRLSEEALENDSLGRQVKSFTAWLKTMKRLHPGQLPEQNAVIEHLIQSSAEASNAEANVLTEAMAEVLVKQDKKEKAIEMYEKLSLINPSKSAYFAARIESLKTS